MSEIGRILQEDYRLTTAEILYHLPDHPSLLQTYVWQDLDLTPEFPQLKKFLDFWDKAIEGKLHSVKVASCELLVPGSYKSTYSSLEIH
jgi:uncharacterized protein Usg